MDSRYSAGGARLAVATLLAGSALLLAPVSIAASQAAPARAGGVAAPAPSKLADSTASTETTGSVQRSASEEEPVCERPRKRLWVEGEGWVVRRVTICR